jgi:hypothetical protein
LKGILESDGYQVELPEDDKELLLARHPERWNLIVGLKPEVPMIGMQTLYRITKPGWGAKGDFLAALNRANGIHFMVSVFSPEELDSVHVSTFMFLSERVSSRDIRLFIDQFRVGVSSVMQNSGLMKFS